MDEAKDGPLLGKGCWASSRAAVMNPTAISIRRTNGDHGNLRWATCCRPAVACRLIRVAESGHSDASVRKV